MTEKMNTKTAGRLLAATAVAELTSLSVSHIRRESRAGKFPQPITISESRVAWPEADVLAWIKSKIEGGVNDGSL